MPWLLTARVVCCLLLGRTAPLPVLRSDLWVIISMMVLCSANAIIEYDRGRSGLSSAPLDMEYDNNSIEQ